MLVCHPKLLLREVNGKDFVKLIVCGREKQASIRFGGVVDDVSKASGGGAAIAIAAPATKSKEKKLKKRKSMMKIWALGSIYLNFKK